MVDPRLFRTLPGGLLAPTDATNEAGGKAYARGPEESLAQYAATGCFGSTYYVSDEDHLKTVLDLAGKCDPEFVAKCAVYARAEGQMKDMPAVLCAVLAKRDVRLLARVFPICIDSPKMVRNFVQAVRSGVAGRKSFPQVARRLIRKWLADRTDASLFHADIGAQPSLADIVKMIHPKPATEERRQMLAYLIGRPFDLSKLPPVVRQFEAFKKGEGEPPDVNFQLLAALDLKPEHWKAICLRASWQTLRMNLNTFQRHGCFEDIGIVGTVAARLQNAEEIQKAKALPYQLLAAYLNVDGVPPGIKLALAQAVEHATRNVPEFQGRTIVCLDVSGSMRSAITGARKGSTSKVRCVDAAALIACSIVRKNPTATVLAFDTGVYDGSLAIRGSVVDSAAALAQKGGGGTDCHLPLMLINQQNVSPDTVIFVSDNESWADPQHGNGTAMMQQFRKLQARHKTAKLVCIDLTPNTTKQAGHDPAVLNVGGFSDAVWPVIDAFVRGGTQWLDRIKAVALPA